MHVHRIETARLLGDLVTGREAVLGVDRGGLVPFTNIELPTTVPPNTRVEVRANVANEADVILPLVEQDICTRGGFNGFQIEVELEVDGRTVGSSSKCIGAGGNRPFDFSFTSPDEPGEITAVLTSRGDKTGNLLNTEQRTITVREDAPQPPEPDDGDGQPGQFRPFLCLLNPLRACNFREQVAMGGGIGFFTILLLLAAF